MTTLPNTQAGPTPLSDVTKSALRDFVRTAVSGLSDVLNEEVPDWESDSRWERGTDEHFRERTEHTRLLHRLVVDNWLGGRRIGVDPVGMENEQCRIASEPLGIRQGPPSKVVRRKSHQGRELFLDLRELLFQRRHRQFGGVLSALL